MRKKRVRKSKEGSCLLLFSEYNKSHLNGNKSSEREAEGRRMARNRQERTLKMHSLHYNQISFSINLAWN
jgi:hypothetical protein